MDKKTPEPVESTTEYEDWYLIDNEYDDYVDDVLNLRDEYYFENIEELLE